MKQYLLEKVIWTEDDFELMGWHDSLIYGIAFDEKSEFILDIDYIFKWIDPIGDNKYFKFWVSPCTLVFENVYDLKIEVEISEPFELEIADIFRENPQRPKNAEYINREIEYDWIIETHNGDITFKSVGYKQFVRELPKLIEQQQLGIEGRNGISFNKTKLNHDK